MKLFEQRLSYVKMQPKSQTKVSLLRLNLVCPPWNIGYLTSSCSPPQGSSGAPLREPGIPQNKVENSHLKC